MAPSGLTGKSAFAFCDTRWEVSEKLRWKLENFSPNVCFAKRDASKCILCLPLNSQAFSTKWKNTNLTITCEVAWWAVILQVRPTTGKIIEFHLLMDFLKPSNYMFALALAALNDVDQWNAKCCTVSSGLSQWAVV